MGSEGAFTFWHIVQAELYQSSCSAVIAAAIADIERE